MHQHGHDPHGPDRPPHQEGKAHARICFIGPCAAKKLEASRRSVRSEVDFVLTFEELMGLFEAKAVNFADLPDNPEDAFNSASADARGFAASGGVAQAVVNAIKKMDPDREVKVMSAQGLADCKKMMMMAKPASTTATCWKAWAARAAALPVPVRWLTPPRALLC